MMGPDIDNKLYAHNKTENKFWSSKFFYSSDPTINSLTIVICYENGKDEIKKSACMYYISIFLSPNLIKCIFKF